jgi:hypothetical protein
MKRFRTRVFAETIALASVFVVVFLGQAGVASAASRGFRIYNLSSHPLKLVYATAQGSGCDGDGAGCWEGRPPLGAVLKPGEAPQHWELKYGFGGYHYHALLRFDVVGTQDEVAVELDTYTTENDSSCRGSSDVKCAAGGLKVAVLDPPGTAHDIGPEDAQQQADILRELCTASDVATCKFDPTDEKKLLGPMHLVGDPVNNCTDGMVDDRVTRSDTVGQSDSVGVETTVTGEGGFIFEKASIAVTAKYGHEWTKTHTFSQDLLLHVKPGDLAWVTSAPPIYRDYGDFTLTLGNTTWTLRHVYFDTPIPDGNAEFTPDHRALTPDEYKQKCTHNPPTGAKGLSKAPPSWVSIPRVGSPGHNRMVGGPESDVMRGSSGNDAILGRGGVDRLYGGTGNDRLFGDLGNDLLAGGTGNDVLNGGPGRDVLNAGPANDTLFGGPGHDTLNGGPGADTIIDTRGSTMVRTGGDSVTRRDYVDVRDGRGDDTVTCGTRQTLVVADPGDRVLGPCGTVIRHGPAPNR